MIGQLSRLERLRRRDVDRAARAAAEAQAELERGMQAETVAAAALANAHACLARAVDARAISPGDEAARLYVHRCEEAIADAERALDHARRSLAAAEHDAEQARREWMRAQVRRDAIVDLAAGQRREVARGRERRQADETQETRSAGGPLWA